MLLFFAVYLQIVFLIEVEHRGHDGRRPLAHHAVHLRGGVVVDHTRHAHVLLILLHALLCLLVEVAGLQFRIALKDHVEPTHHLPEQVGLLVDGCRCAGRSAVGIAATSLYGLDDGLRLMLGILRRRLGQGYHGIETGVELNLNLAQGVLTQFVEIDQRALGGDEITNDDNRHDGNNH